MKEIVMRNVTSLAAAAAFSAAMLLSAPSQAMTPGAASGVKGAAATLDPVEKTACWRYGYGYRRWGGYGYGGWGYRRWHYSDQNLKRDIVPVGHLANGLGLYRFSYNDSDKVYVGVIAQEVERVMPDAVRRAPSGYLQVNYARIGM